ncbi:MAG: hypothetical protein AAFZ89_07670 [Bacteroidota bacterium]
MKKLFSILFLLTLLHVSGQETNRIQRISNNLELLALENSGLNENLKLEVNVANVTLPNFLIAVSKVHRLNLSVSPDINNITIVNNFADVTVRDLLVFLCKEYGLDIEFTGTILSVKKYKPPTPEVVEKEVHVEYSPLNRMISLDIKNDPLEKVFRKIMDITGENLLYTSGMESIPISMYLSNVPFDTAMKKLAGTNKLSFSKSRDGFYLFDTLDNTPNTIEGSVQTLANRPRRRNSQGSNFQYQVIDTLNRILHVDFENVPIVDIIREISYDLHLDVYTATPLEEAGEVSFKAKQISYDMLLERIFESKANDNTPGPIQQSNASTARNRASVQNGARTNLPSSSYPTNFTFKKEGGIYFFGTADQLSVRKTEVVQMMHRSVELLGDPTPYTGAARAAGRTVGGNVNYLGGGIQPGQGLNNIQATNNATRRINTTPNTFGNYGNNAEALVNILPDDILADLDVKIDYELNSFLVSGPAANINRFKNFIREIDKPVPVVLIEVMLIEVRKSATVETGISWGIGDEPVSTRGSVFPETDLTLGAGTVNKIIGGFDGFGSFNIGKVVPEFFATIKAMEANGNLKIRSTPKLSTLNGHRANLSIGETTYYVVTNQNFFGSQIPTTSEVRNFQPIDAELAVSIKPLVSGNGQVTLDINVVQSDFNGERIEDEAPPGLTSREFSSIIRMQNQDLAVLGGLEEKVKNDSGNGVPLLARIPVIKWLFSKRTREDTKQKLTILIKPTVIY